MPGTAVWKAPHRPAGDAVLDLQDFPRQIARKLTASRHRASSSLWLSGGSVRPYHLGLRRGLFFAASNSATVVNASRLPMPRTATRAASWALRGRDFSCSQL